jgi:hypothetical protein
LTGAPGDVGDGCGGGETDERDRAVAKTHGETSLHFAHLYSPQTIAERSLMQKFETVIGPLVLVRT